MDQEDLLKSEPLWENTSAGKNRHSLGVTFMKPFFCKVMIAEQLIYRFTFPDMVIWNNVYLFKYDIHFISDLVNMYSIKDRFH